MKVNGLDIFYREAGPKDAPVVLLPHGFPTSSHMFRNLIPALADEFRLIAPDYPGFGNSSMPTVDEFEYTFDNLVNVIEQFTEQLGLTKYSLYAQDYGGPVSFRLAVKHPERVQALVVQNGNAYDEGIDNDFWKPIKAYWKQKNPESEKYIRNICTREGTIFQYTNGVRNIEAISPDNWNIDPPLLDRPGNAEIQLALFYSYGSNPPLYPDVAGVLPQIPAAHAHHLGKERRDLSRRGRGTVQTGFEEPGVSPAGYRALRAGRGWR